MKDPLLKDQTLLESVLSGSRVPSARSTISTSESGQELWPVGVKLGIVRLGHAAGKLKYTLVDEQDIILAREYTFEARLEIDRHGTGAVVFAYAYLTNQNRGSAILLQDLIWRRHNGPIPERKRVVHRNHISMDNRLDNLCLIDIRNAHVWYTCRNVMKSNSGSHSTSSGTGSTTPNGNGNADNSKVATNDLQLTLYWAAIQQLPPEHVQNEQSATTTTTTTTATTATTSSQATANATSSSNTHNHNNSTTAASITESYRCYDSDGNKLDDEDGISYYECHYAPCVRIEREPREFSICGRCQETRYCGTMCQQLDWSHHKRQCRMKARRTTPYWRRWEPER